MSARISHEQHRAGGPCFCRIESTAYFNMSPIETVIEYELDLTTHVVSGSILTSELIDKITEYYTATPTNLLLWDFSLATFRNIKSTEVEVLSNISRQFSHLRKDGKTALLFASDEGFGLGRMYDSHKELDDAGYQYMSFRTKRETLRWLGVAV